MRSGFLSPPRQDRTDHTDWDCKKEKQEGSPGLLPVHHHEDEKHEGNQEAAKSPGKGLLESSAQDDDRKQRTDRCTCKNQDDSKNFHRSIHRDQGARFTR